jgi:hypothetical protein
MLGKKCICSPCRDWVGSGGGLGVDAKTGIRCSAFKGSSEGKLKSGWLNGLSFNAANGSFCRASEVADKIKSFVAFGDALGRE